MLLKISTFKIFLITSLWFLSSLSYTFGTECRCCQPHKIPGQCNEITTNEKSCLEIQCLFKDSPCQCISTGTFNHHHILPQKEYNTKLSKNRLSVFTRLLSLNSISIDKGPLLQHPPATFSFPCTPRFLLNASFLL